MLQVYFTCSIDHMCIVDVPKCTRRQFFSECVFSPKVSHFLPTYGVLLYSVIDTCVVWMWCVVDSCVLTIPTCIPSTLVYLSQINTLILYCPKFSQDVNFINCLKVDCLHFHFANACRLLVEEARLENMVLYCPHESFG